jgi:predicted transposase/invertase (TIGR01784 family)
MDNEHIDMHNDMHSDGLPRILPAYENGVFQAVLTLPEAYNALIDMVAAFLNRRIVRLTLRNNNMPSRDVYAKSEEFDINCVVDGEDGDQCGIEMQASPMEGDKRDNDHRNIKWRSVFNVCDLHANQPGRGRDYGEFLRSYQIMLCNYRVFDGAGEPAEPFTFRNRAGRELCDAVTVVFVDLTQAREIAKKPIEEMTDAEAWIVFFALANKPRYRQTIEEITKTREGIAVANETLLSISQDADERARLLSHRIWLRDREHDMAVARKEGRAELEPLLAEKDAEIADKDAVIAEQAALIAQLQARLGESD